MYNSAADASSPDDVKRMQPQVNTAQDTVNRLQHEVNLQQNNVNTEQQKVNREQHKVNELHREVSAEFNRRLQEILQSALQRGLTSVLQ